MESFYEVYFSDLVTNIVLENPTAHTTLEWIYRHLGKSEDVYL